MTVLAVPFTPVPPEKLSTILDACVKHDPWFHDFLDTPEKKREAVSAYLADAFSYGKLWEVWRDNELVGIMMLNEVVPFLDARCHFLFFDGKLADKAQLCLNYMEWGFNHLPVEVLRVEMPTYARALLKFARRLGFRFEGEHSPYSWPKDAAPLSADVAKLGSRKHRATLYHGEWHDVLLLSVTRDEFEALKKEPP